MLRFSLRRAVLTASAIAVCAPVAPAAAQTFADPSTPGPELSVSQNDVDRILACSAGVDGATRAPVLLVQGTGATAKDNWSWTYQPALTQAGIPWCTLDVPEQATQDIQRSGEMIVVAIRTLHRRAGRKMSIIGHSQGGMSPRFALRFWPDTRAMVDDLIGFAPSNHGSSRANCNAQNPCSAATFQQSDKSNFMKALNSSAETFAGVSYTNVYTRTDETVQPNMDDTGSSSLRTGAGLIENHATQEVCPSAAYEHLAVGTVDAVAHALAIDALEHPGPAVPSRLNVATVCSRTYHPGINTLTLANDAGMAAASFQTFKPRTVTVEPALRCYVTASCAKSAPTTAPAPGAMPAPGATPAPAKAAAPRTCTSRRRFTVRLPRLRALRVTLAGKRVAVRRGGRPTAVVDLRKRPRTTVVLRITGRSDSGRRVTQTRRYRTCG